MSSFDDLFSSFMELQNENSEPDAEQNEIVEEETVEDGKALEVEDNQVEICIKSFMNTPMHQTPSTQVALIIEKDLSTAELREISFNDEVRQLEFEELPDSRESFEDVVSEIRELRETLNDKLLIRNDNNTCVSYNKLIRSIEEFLDSDADAERAGELVTSCIDYLKMFSGSKLYGFGRVRKRNVKKILRTLIDYGNSMKEQMG